MEVTSVEDFSFRKERVFDENGQSQRVWGVGVPGVQKRSNTHPHAVEKPSEYVCAVLISPRLITFPFLAPVQS
ncbi:hypothetical protein WN943_017440 [Citrus x changshan-huyou]